MIGQIAGSFEKKKSFNRKAILALCEVVYVDAPSTFPQGIEAYRTTYSIINGDDFLEMFGSS